MISWKDDKVSKSGGHRTGDDVDELFGETLGSTSDDIE